MNITLRNLLLLFSVVCTLTAFAPVKSNFSAAEQQQISIATPKLFALSNTFNIELGNLSTNEYTFPLPVGKAIRQADNRLEITWTEGDARVHVGRCQGRRITFLFDNQRYFLKKYYLYT